MSEPAGGGGDLRYTRVVEDVINAERAHLQRIRGWRFAARGAETPLIGLALSGGGIRSAAFAFGAMHALVRNDKLRWFDYMSTVSGGGYAGAALTWMLSTYAGADVAPNSPKGPGSFPLSGWRQGRRTTTNNPPAKFDALPYRRLDWIRLRANYLTPTDEFNARRGAAKRAASSATSADPPAPPPPAPPGDRLPYGGLGFASVIGVVLRSVIIGLFTYFPMMLVVMLLMAWLTAAADVPLTHLWPEWKSVAAPLTHRPWEGVFLLLAAATFIFFVALCLLYALVTRVNRLWSYPMRTQVQWAGGWILTVIAIALVMVSLPYAPAGFERLATAAGLTAGGIAAAIIRLLLRAPGGSTVEWSTRAVAAAGGLALCYGLLLATHVAAFELYNAMRETEPLSGPLGWMQNHPTKAVLLTLAWAGFAGFMLNLNYVTPHRMYRDRLMEAFMPRAPIARRGFEDTKPDRAALADMCGAKPGTEPDGYPGPYHLINANVVLTGSRYEGARGRGGDAFLLSPLYCGAHRMGWYPSQRPGMAPLKPWAMTLATAMSISGAAANPSTGAGGQGPTRFWPIAFLMNLLHLRLGYVEINPQWVDRLGGKWERYILPARPNGLLPGLPHLGGAGHHEEAPFVELSDGGHFENLGIYELLRREVRVIVCCDAGCDGGFAFFDLTNALERARVDFGVNIRFAGERPLADLVLPPLAKRANAFRAEFARRGYAIAEIRYPPTRRVPPLDNEPTEAPDEAAKRRGILIYVKSTMIADLPADLYGYRAAFPDFPHQSTADQWFDEPQFEAYRELGYRLMVSCLGDDAVNKLLGGDDDAPVASADADRLIAEALDLAERQDRREVAAAMTAAQTVR